MKVLAILALLIAGGAVPARTSTLCLPPDPPKVVGNYDAPDLWKFDQRTIA